MYNPPACSITSNFKIRHDDCINSGLSLLKSHKNLRSAGGWCSYLSVLPYVVSICAKFKANCFLCTERERSLAKWILRYP